MTMPENPNPQGKGLVPILQTLHQQRLQTLVPPKHIDQVEMELFTSLFILQSEIRFSPVAGKSYWLYQTEGRFKLLLIGPHEWHTPYRGRFIGECVLQDDRTWTLSLAPAMADDREFMNLVEKSRRNLEQAMLKADTLEEVLPKYNPAFSFHARVMAYTLGRSLHASMQLSGIRSLSYAQAKGLLSHEK